jgi:hypothetical protein
MTATARHASDSITCRKTPVSSGCDFNDRCGGRVAASTGTSARSEVRSRANSVAVAYQAGCSLAVIQNFVRAGSVCTQAGSSRLTNAGAVSDGSLTSQTVFPKRLSASTQVWTARLVTRRWIDGARADLILTRTAESAESRPNVAKLETCAQGRLRTAS